MVVKLAHLKKNFPMKDKTENLKVRITPALKKSIDDFIKQRKKESPEGKWSINNVVIVAIQQWIDAWGE